jgi:hypothetical protein
LGSWFAFDEADFIGKVRAARADIGGVILSKCTPRQLAATCGVDGSDLASQLAARFGWETTLYRADYLLAPAHYQTEEVSEFIASVAALARGLKACRVYPDEELAMEALLSEPLYSKREGFYAHMALRDQLIALEVLSDDL